MSDKSAKNTKKKIAPASDKVSEQKTGRRIWMRTVASFKKYWLPTLIGFFVGALVVLAIRFFTYRVEQVHYHANFAVYIDGQQRHFNDQGDYEETSMCTLNARQSELGITDPVERVHMHKMSGDQVIHVEDHAVTYGAFFTNLGWSLGANFAADRSGNIYQTSGDKRLNIILNGENITGQNIANRIIKDKDVLLISYGDESDATLKAEYDKIPRTAEKYDTTDDPASCAGSQTDKTTFGDRIKHLF